MSKGQVNPKNQKLAELLRKRRVQLGESMPTFAGRFLPESKEPERTYINWEQGLRAPQAGVRAAVEKAIGWKPGSIDRLLSGEGVFLSLDDVQEPPTKDQPVKRASELTDDELLSEVTRRFKNYADAAREVALANAPEQPAVRNNVTPLRSMSEPSRIDEGSERFAARQDGEYEDGDD